ncbi:MAG: response regulator transcription factor [Anaerolineae bacterium]
MNEIPVLVVDDHPGFRRSVVHLLTSVDQFAVVGEAANSAEALTLACALRPRIVILDIRMPGLNGLTIIDQLKANVSGVIVVVLTLWDTPHYREAAQNSGADAFVVKENMFVELLPKIEQLLSSANSLKVTN